MLSVDCGSPLPLLVSQPAAKRARGAKITLRRSGFHPDSSAGLPSRSLFDRDGSPGLLAAFKAALRSEVESAHRQVGIVSRQ